MKGTYCAKTSEEMGRLRKLLYPRGFIVRPIVDQIRDLATILSLEAEDALRYAESVDESLPGDSDGLFAMIQPDALGSTDSTLSALLAVLCNRRPFSSFDAGKFGSVQLRQDARSIRAFGWLGARQTGSIVVVPAQLGIMYAGRTPENSLARLDQNEFALGPVEVCSMILAHPSWSQHIEHFQVLCPGARYVRQDADSNQDSEFIPRFGDDEVAYDAVTMRFVRPFAGMATGFLETTANLSGSGL